MNAHDLHKKYSAAELAALQRAICADPANANPSVGGIFKYTPEAHKKLAAIAHAIRWHMMDGEASVEREAMVAASDANAELNWGVATDLMADAEIREALEEYRSGVEDDPTVAVSLIVSMLVARAEAP